MKRTDALISPCERYRWWLLRTWSSSTSKRICWIMLNPSTADANEDDPTIKRCIKYSQDWGFSGMYVVNLFAYRSTDRRQLNAVQDPVGKEFNDMWIKHYCKYADEIVCAWGADGIILNRSARVQEMLKDYKLKCLTITKDGEPGHPLYLKGDLQLIDFGIKK